MTRCGFPARRAQTRNRRIRIERPDTAANTNEYGELDLTTDAAWRTYCERYAAVQTKGGREFWKVDKVEADVNLVLNVVRDTVTAAITPDMRVILEGRVLQIVAALDIDAAHREVEIQCREAA